MKKAKWNLSWLPSIPQWLKSKQPQLGIDGLRDEFFHNFSKKYELKSDRALGDGHYARVFHAFDKDRKVDVAIKIFFDGIAPTGSQRGWQITSTVVHNQIGPTSTVESYYSRVLRKDCKAAVQRLIPGKSLRSLLTRFDAIENMPGFGQVLNDFGVTYLPSLLEVLSLCHSLGFGHGDCHDGNIMVFLQTHPTKNSLRVVLIDFDNASIKETLNLQTEQEKMDSDIRLLRFFFTKTFYQWKYYEPVKELFNSYQTMREIQFSYSIVSYFIKLCNENKTTLDDISKVFAKLPHPLMGFQFHPTLKCLREIAGIEKIVTEYDGALNQHKTKIADYNNWDADVTIEFIKNGVNEIYLHLFEN